MNDKRETIPQRLEFHFDVVLKEPARFFRLPIMPSEPFPWVQVAIEGVAIGLASGAAWLALLAMARP